MGKPEPKMDKKIYFVREKKKAPRSDNQNQDELFAFHSVNFQLSSSVEAKKLKSSLEEKN